MRLNTLPPLFLTLFIIACDSDKKPLAEANKVIAPTQSPMPHRQSSNTEAAGLRFDSSRQALTPLSEQNTTTHDQQH